MRAGQQVTFVDTDGAEHQATVVAVKGGDTPGPRILDLKVGQDAVSDVVHETLAASGQVHWKL